MACSRGAAADTLGMAEIRPRRVRHNATRDIHRWMTVSRVARHERHTLIRSRVRHGLVPAMFTPASGADSSQQAPSALIMGPIRHP